MLVILQACDAIHEGSYSFYRGTITYDSSGDPGSLKRVKPSLSSFALFVSFILFASCLFSIYCYIALLLYSFLYMLCGVRICFEIKLHLSLEKNLRIGGIALNREVYISLEQYEHPT